MKIYRLVSDDGRVYHSKQFKGFYDTPERAQRASRYISPGYTIYKKKEGGRYSWELDRDANGNLIVEKKVKHNWRVQEAEVTWHDYTFPADS